MYDIVLHYTLMDYSTKTLRELIATCKEKGIKGYSGKKKNEIISMLSVELDTTKTTEITETIKTIRYIGCKQKLLNHLHKHIKLCSDKISKDRPCVLFDAFAGTGTVSAYFAANGYDIMRYSKNVNNSY
jgi:hypothetical protein